MVELAEGAQRDKPLRICQLFTSVETGGLEKHVQELSSWQLQNCEAEVYVIAHPRYRAMFPAGVHFLAVNTDRGRRNPLLSFELLRLMRRYRFDLVHAHAAKPAYLMRRLQRWIPGKVVLTRHNVANPKDSLSKHFPHRIAVSQMAVANSALRWQVIPNGTRLPKLGEGYRSVLDSGKPAVISVARLVPAKGIDLLLRAWAQAQVGDAVLYILGDGPLRAELERLGDELQLGERVKFVGFQSHVADWMSVADLMVVASSKEGAPYTVAEALLAGCPLVSTHVGNVAENIPASYLVDIGDTAGLAVKLTSALGDLEQLRDNYSPYFARARERLTLDAMATETMKVYRAALASAPLVTE
ncbi:glycosyltransferase family 4 protein [Microbulbifer sp. CAU 1566]|uniref:glycosyltransferase family 4 protein n=1 Tax=Microbulbifer sp. CAU 1566 TaxID=2933269 RepID=UPI002006728F|nr:glycosyltransferase family 4 protein [Microbulbifer sp. CAU 1566]MCK7596389.1 glycosyltransferase family 4 protein [Microbulbifer sp. CAU 1566]